MGMTAAVCLLAASVASAMVIDPDVEKDLAKLRKNIGKQGAKHVFCLVKAATKCEQDGVDASLECNLASGAVAYDVPPAKATQKFQDAIAKCDEKYNPSKKGNDYVGIGCPGDCNVAAAGVQRCANMTAYEAIVEGTTGITAAKVQLGALAALINAACATDGVGSSNADPLRIACVEQNAATLSRYSKGLFKCVSKCENDFKNKKGNGGPTNGPNCLSQDPGVNGDFDACDDEALLKAIDKEGALTSSNISLLLPQIRDAINDATNLLYNRSDPTLPLDPESSPCGSCGNAIREGAEECDGGDDAACSGSCNADCTCP
jgi:hypothetical protein